MSPKIRQTIYQLGTVLTGLLGIALIWGGIDAGAANSVGTILEGLVALLGTGGLGLAAAKTGEQIKDHQLEAPTDPLQQILHGVDVISQTKAQAETAYAEAQKKLAELSGNLSASGAVPFRPPSSFGDLVGNVVAPVPIIGPLAQTILRSTDRFR